MTTIREWQTEVHRLAREKGWHPPDIDPREPNRALALLMLVTTELAEAAECIRTSGFEPYYETTSSNPNQKPCGLPSEAADAVIRILDACEAWGIDLQSAIEEKHEYNKCRAFRHGGKAV